VIIYKKKLSIKQITKKEELKFKKIFNIYIKEILKVKYISESKIDAHLIKIKNNIGKINWIIEKNKQIGFLVFFLNHEKLNCYIRDFFILKKYRKKEVGTLIVKKLIASCNRRSFKFIKIDIIKTNKSAIKFWKKLNFKKNGKSYYLKLDK
tara:strand:+ start:1419 stop:1871 length:453 start_codon:yes stop_codon:yes gene_type:complete